MEQALGSSYTPRGTFRGTYALVRYADDVAIFCPTHAEAMEAKSLLAFLADRDPRVYQGRFAHWWQKLPKPAEVRVIGT